MFGLKLYNIPCGSSCFYFFAIEFCKLWSNSAFIFCEQVFLGILLFLFFFQAIQASSSQPLATTDYEISFQCAQPFSKFYTLSLNVNVQISLLFIFMVILIKPWYRSHMHIVYRIVLPVNEEPFPYITNSFFMLKFIPFSMLHTHKHVFSLLVNILYSSFDFVSHSFNKIQVKKYIKRICLRWYAGRG